MRPTTPAPARAESGAAPPGAEPAGPRPGSMRRVARGRRVQVEMLGADGAWSPVFCYNEPPDGGQDDLRGGPGDPR